MRVNNIAPPAPFLANEREIARHIVRTSIEEVELEFVEGRLFDSHAVLRKVRLDALKPGPEDNNLPDERKAAQYARLPIETQPPIVIEDLQILDGHHRYRRTQETSDTIWCYDIRAGRDPDFVFVALDYEAMDNALSGQVVGKKGSHVISHWLEIKDVPYFHGFPWRKDDYLWIVALDARKRPKDGLHAAAGLLELQRNPENASEIWLKNIGTREEVRQRGVASGLIDEMVRVLSERPEHDWVLARSRASEAGETYLQKKIDDALDQAGIAWTQGGRKTHHRMVY